MDIVNGTSETFSCEVKDNEQVIKKKLVLHMESEFFLYIRINNRFTQIIGKCQFQPKFKADCLVCLV